MDAKANNTRIEYPAKECFHVKYTVWLFNLVKNKNEENHSLKKVHIRRYCNQLRDGAYKETEWTLWPV